MSILLLPAMLALLGEPQTSPAKTRLAITALSPAGVPAELAAGLTETLATAISNTGAFETVSPRQIASLLAYEKRRDVLGSCDGKSEDTRCFQQIAKIVRADHLVGGSIAQIGDRLSLNLVLVETETGNALRRTERASDIPAELLIESKRAAITLLAPLLSERRGFVKVEATEPDAAIRIDDERRIEGVGQLIPLPAGPHVLSVSKDGFYSAMADLNIRPGRVLVEKVSLIPAKETIEEYESQATLMRTGAYVTGALAVSAAVLSGVFYSQASDNRLEVDRFAGSLDVEQTAERRVSALTARDDFETHQGLYLGFLGGAVVAGAASVYLFLAGDDPDRFEEFHSLGK